ncbi:MAG: hypothetical protein ACRDCB_02505 [Clostridium sp.]|uniref:hypothetical protein n=1 Tax=Clostridium chrysemydis TaxID=2665504 RepID=UPI003EE74E86
MKFKNKSKGSITVEAAFIVPMITCILILIIFMGILLYSKFYASVSVNNSISRASASWYGVEDEIANTDEYGNPVKGSESLGYVLAGINTSKSVESKLNALKKDIKNKIEKGSPMKVNVEVTTNRNSAVILDNIQVKVVCKYRLPMKGVFGIFQVGDEKGNVQEVIERSVSISSSENNTRTYTFTKKMLVEIVELFAGEDLVTKFKEIIGGIKDAFNNFV